MPSILIAACVACSAAAVEEHQVQGNYDAADHGTAKVIAQGGGKYRVLWNVSDEVVEFAGSTPGKGKNPTFDGTVQLDGEQYKVGGRYQDGGTIALSLTGGKKLNVAMKRVELGSPTLGAKPPEGAIVLMDGSNLDEWETSPLKWRLHGNGEVEVANPDLISKRSFGDHKLHLEFRTPFMPSDRGQARGNSGVYLHGVYEVQVLDSFGLPPADNDCGGIYKIAVPSMNMCLPPLEWQTYDITFHAPRFDAAGKKTKNARITVVHNGETIHDDLELPGLTGGAMRDTEEPTGPLKLQHHHDAVRYRNVWALPLD